MTRLSRLDALDALRRGDVVLLNTDTLPGLHALATVEGAAERIAALKGHPPERPYLLLVASVDAAFALGRAAGVELEASLRELWPAPLTALLRPLPSTPREWTRDGLSVGVRVPAAAALRELLGELPGPLFSTSANRAGEAPAEDMAGAEKVFVDLDSVELGDPTSRGASTIVDYAVNPPKLVRAGLVPFGPGGRLDALMGHP